VNNVLFRGFIQQGRDFQQDFSGFFRLLFCHQGLEILDGFLELVLYAHIPRMSFFVNP